jgi:hypothetical protein
LVDPSGTAIEQLAESKAENVHMSLVISIPFSRNCDERAGECGYIPSIFIFEITSSHCEVHFHRYSLQRT